MVKISIRILFFLISALFGIQALALVPKQQIALVYKGPGSCIEDCSEAAAEIARQAGLTPVFVGPEASRDDLFENAAVWIQPGGKSATVGKNMNTKLKNMIRDFVAAGGGYVGFCAGGFYATDEIGDTGYPGLGLIHAKSFLYEEVDDHSEILSLRWGNLNRGVYWEGGPYFVIDSNQVKDLKKNPIHILATYPNGSAATIMTYFGYGKVVVTGAHPEAPAWWSVDEKISDYDGVDHDLAVDMVLKAM